MKTVWRNLALVAVAALGAAAIMEPAFAEEAAAAAAKVAVKAPDLVVNKADDGWMMTSSLLVLLMTVPGLALFYGGMVRTKNMLSMLTQVLMIQCIVCVAWFVYGYSLAFTEGQRLTSPLHRRLRPAVHARASTPRRPPRPSRSASASTSSSTFASR